MIDRSGEEAKAEYEHVMGKKVGRTFYALTAEVHLLHVKWGDYMALYDKRSRVELLNHVAPAYFARLQDVYIHDTFLHISRLTDEPKSGSRTRLPISGLVGMIEAHDLRRKLRPLVADMNRKVRALRSWRDRRIAHHEHDLALGQATEPLPPTTRAMTQSAIEAIAAVLHAVCQHYQGSDLRFRFESRPGTHALALLYCMDDGLKAAKQRDDRIAAGDYRAEDLEPVDL